MLPPLLARQQRGQSPPNPPAGTTELLQANAALHQELAAARLEQQQALAEAEQRLEQASRAKSEFLSNISHEIRTPMNGIMGLTQLVLATELTPVQRDYLQKVLSSAQTLMGVINDILDFSQIEAGRMALAAEEFSLAEVMDKLSKLFEASAKQKGLQLRFELAPEVPPYWVGDALRLGQILGNLLGNAIKFTPSGEIVVQAGIQRNSSGRLLLAFSVRDTGIGMGQEQVARLFQPFTQADGTSTRRYGGTGLGLSVCRKLVQLMDGEITVRSELGCGSEFTVTLYLQPADQPYRPPSPQPQIQPAGHLAGARLLLVEDDDIHRMVAQTYLQGCHFTVITATNGREAVEKAGATTLDAVLMDWYMPEMNGLEATRLIRALPGKQHLPIIAMTAAAMSEDKAECLAAGMNDYVAKPVNPEELLDKLNHWISAGRPAQASGAAAYDARQAQALIAQICALIDGDEYIPQTLVHELRLALAPIADEVMLDGLVAAVENCDYAQARQWLANQPPSAPA
jgi:signal transduction histidine kinase/CheY-like chemotaxis protein